MPLSAYIISEIQKQKIRQTDPFLKELTIPKPTENTRPADDTTRSGGSEADTECIPAEIDFFI